MRHFKILCALAVLPLSGCGLDTPVNGINSQVGGFDVTNQTLGNYSAGLNADVAQQIQTNYTRELAAKGQKVRCSKVSLVPRDSQGLTFSGVAEFSDGSQFDINVTWDAVASRHIATRA